MNVGRLVKALNQQDVAAEPGQPIHKKRAQKVQE